jgi:hypothetical protein
LPVQDGTVAAARDDDVPGAREAQGCGMPSGLAQNFGGRGVMAHGNAARQCSAQRGSGLVAERVVADAADEGDFGAQPRRGHGPVRALATRGLQQVFAQHRFTGGRQLRAAQHQVDVDAADDDDAPCSADQHGCACA